MTAGLVRNFVESLEQSQWWDSHALQRAQFQRLRKLSVHAYSTVPFYRDRMDETGIDPGRVTPEAWARLPLLSRQDVQAQGAALRSTGVPRSHGKAQPATTSGSVGVPVIVEQTALAAVTRSAALARFWQWHGFDIGGKLATVRRTIDEEAPYPDGRIKSSWGESADALGRSGPCTVLDLRTPVEQQLVWLARQNPDYLTAYAANLGRLAELSLDAGIALPRLRAAVSSSAVLTPSIRHVVRTAWGVEVADTYSATEVGVIALQCPQFPIYHAQSELVLVEVLGADDRPCRPGDIGKVVVTPLLNFAMPLLRYEIGDYAEIGEPCSCGRGLPVITRILGRYRNLISLPDGRQFWPIFDYHKFRAVAPVRQYQIVQREPDRLEARLVVDRALDAHQEEHIRAVLVAEIGYPFRVTFSYPEQIERSPSGKFEDVVSEVSPPSTPRRT